MEDNERHVENEQSSRHEQKENPIKYNPIKYNSIKYICFTNARFYIDKINIYNKIFTIKNLICNRSFR